MIRMILSAIIGVCAGLVVTRGVITGDALIMVAGMIEWLTFIVYILWRDYHD